MKAIETRYKGHRFRSRTEARWAVYFDEIGLKWEYEKEGYVLDDGTKYLADFWLTDVRMWAEVKGKSATAQEIDRCYRLAKGTGYPCLMLDGFPDTRAYRVWGADTGSYACVLTRFRDSLNPYHLIEVESSCAFPDHTGCRRCLFPDMYAAVEAARSARFGT